MSQPPTWSERAIMRMASLSVRLRSDQPVCLQVLRQMPLHGVGLISGERAVPRLAAHEVEAVRVPVVPVVAPALDVEPAPSGWAAMPRSSGGQIGTCAGELVTLSIELPLGDAVPHPIVVGPEVRVSDDQSRV